MTRLDLLDLVVLFFEAGAEPKVYVDRVIPAPHRSVVAPVQVMAHLNASVAVASDKLFPQ